PVADVAVVARDGRATDAHAGLAGVAGRARVAVGAGIARDRGRDAAEQRAAGILRADVEVVAARRRAGAAGAVDRVAGLLPVARVAVVAGGRGDAPERRAAGVRRAGRAVVAVGGLRRQARARHGIAPLGPVAEVAVVADRHAGDADVVLAGLDAVAGAPV